MDAFTGNLHAFHHPSGRGHAFVADVVLAADSIDPQAVHPGATRALAH